MAGAEINLGGERAADELSQRVIAELRREVEQLRADAVKANQGRTPR
jgi:uncharacterized small protein (DUF1192 family)